MSSDSLDEGLLSEAAADQDELVLATCRRPPMPAASLGSCGRSLSELLGMVKEGAC